MAFDRERMYRRQVMGLSGEDIVPALKWIAPLVCLLVTPVAAQQVQWEKLPRMQLERQFAGPLKDTVIQRWRDPADGTICYIYLPITAPHSPPTGSGYVQYSANTIGSISCVAAPPRLPSVPSPRPRSAPAR